MGAGLVGGDTQKIWPAPSEDERLKSPREQGLWRHQPPAPRPGGRGRAFGPESAEGVEALGPAGK